MIPRAWHFLLPATPTPGREASVNFTWDYPSSVSLDTWFYRGDAGRITLQFPQDNSLSGSSPRWAFGWRLTKRQLPAICLQLWREVSMLERSSAVVGVVDAAWLENWMPRGCKTIVACAGCSFNCLDCRNCYSFKKTRLFSLLCNLPQQFVHVKG